jgi:hypothetical protein
MLEALEHLFLTLALIRGGYRRRQRLTQRGEDRDVRLELGGSRRIPPRV